jgi:hypothetical protein
MDVLKTLSDPALQKQIKGSAFNEDDYKVGIASYLTKKRKLWESFGGKKFQEVNRYEVDQAYQDFMKLGSLYYPKMSMIFKLRDLNGNSITDNERQSMELWNTQGKEFVKELRPALIRSDGIMQREETATAVIYYLPQRESNSLAA